MCTVENRDFICPIYLLLASPQLPVKERLSAPLDPRSFAQRSYAFGLKSWELALGKLDITKLYGSKQ